jgi:hypothetical protein
MVPLALKEPAKPFLRDIGLDRRQEPAFAAHRQSARVKVRAKDLNFRPQFAARRLFEKQDRARICQSGASEHGFAGMSLR